MTELAPKTTLNRDERLIAAVSHGLVLAFGLGMIGATVIWVLQKEKSRYAAFQALQAAAYQFIGFLAYMLCWICWGSLYGISFIPIIMNPQQYENKPPAFFFVSLALMVIPLALAGLWVLYGLWAGVRTLQGREFRYLVIGPWLEHYLGKPQATHLTSAT